MGRECECFLKFRARTLSRRTDCVLLSKARYVEQELLTVKAASFTNKGLAEKFIF